MIIMCIYFDTCCINSNHVNMTTVCRAYIWCVKLNCFMYHCNNDCTISLFYYNIFVTN